jgi:uncharacterized phage protein (TIGR01671 family)
MRKIKFRAWDKEKGKIISNPIINDIDSATNYIGLNTLFEKFLNRNFKIMQFTGLKDKNEKEIYEGDVVKDVGIIGEIIYVECSFRINPEGNKKIEFTESLLNYDNLEVIGNIHENPELLTNK